jgi:uncharacterized membrane protein
MEVLLISGIAFLLISIFIWVKPPKTMNSLYGYRTKNSMKSQARWDFSQKYAAKKMIVSGVLMIAFSLIGYFFTFVIPPYQLLIGIGFLIALAIIPILLTEKALKDKFGND